MRKSKESNHRKESFLQRQLMGALAAFIFTVPTLGLLTIFFNLQYAKHDPNVILIGSTDFWMLVVVFMSVSFIFPELYVSLLGNVWKGIVRIGRFFY